jgi:multiple sugar transport system permease protein
MVYSVFLSLVNFNSLAQMHTTEFFGLRNYVRAFTDRMAVDSFARSLLFSLLYSVGIIVASFLTAVLLDRKLYLRAASRTMIYMPYVANLVAVSIVWTIVLNPFQGPVNSFLKLLGVPEQSLPAWLQGLHTALPTLAAIKVWQNLAFQTVVFLAALQDVPRELYECSEIDGAGGMRKLLHITLPMISPTTFFLVVVTVIGSFNSFTLVKVLTNGGPGSATRIITLFIYEQAVRYSYYSYANALACILFVFILLITLIQWKMQKRWVHY